MSARPIVMQGTLGYDQESNPLSLQVSWLEKGSGFTDSMSDLYSDGTYLFRKRPGMARAGAAAAVSGPIYDLIKMRLKRVDGFLGTDVLIGLYNDSVSAAAGIAYWEAGAGTYALTDLLPGGGADPSMVARMIVAGPYSAYQTKTAERLQTIRVIRGFGINTYERSSLAQVPENAVYNVGMWHKSHLFYGRDARADGNGARVAFSQFNTPDAMFAAGDTFDVDPTGLDSVEGMISVGEVAFIGKTVGIWMLSGSVRETFRADRISSPFGFVGMRTADIVEPGAALALVTESEFASGTASEEATAVNVAILTSGGAKTVGDRVLSSIRVNAFTFIQARVKRWLALRGMLVIPNIHDGTAAATPALFFSTDTGGFWPWTLDATMRPASLEYAERDMFVGCGDGLIRRFLTSAARDGSADIGAFFGSPLFSFNEPQAVQDVIVYGTQTSGGDWTIGVSADGQSFNGTDNPNVTLYATASGTRPVLSASGTIVPFTRSPSGRTIRVRITPPTDGVGCVCYKAITRFKQIGR